MKRALPVLTILSIVTAVFAVGGTGSAMEAAIGAFTNHEDLGVTPKAGSAIYDAEKQEYRVTGGGANMWFKTDAFQFVYKKISGDVTMTADVQFVGSGVEQHRKAALMVRQSLRPDSPYADVALHGDGLTSLQYRTETNTDTEEARSDVKAPVRIQIERHGNQFTIAAGTPGQELKTTGPVTVAMQDPVYIGLAVCSHNANVLETAVFSNLTIKQ